MTPGLAPSPPERFSEQRAGAANPALGWSNQMSGVSYRAEAEVSNHDAGVPSAEAGVSNHDCGGSPASAGSATPGDPAPGQATLFATPEAVSVPAASDLGSPALEPIAGPRRTRIELSPICDALVQRMLAEYRRRGVTVSLSELVEQGLRRLWSDGYLDDVPGLDRSSGDLARPSPDDEIGLERSPGAPDTPSREAPEGREGVDLAMPRRKSEERAAGDRIEGIGSRAEFAAARRVPIADHKILAVVVSIAETGETWMRTLNGVIQVRLADLEGMAPVVQVVTLADLHQRLSKRATAKTLPVSGTLFVAAVSGGRCQRQGCNKPAVLIHHQKPRAEGGDHSPGNTFGLCPSCHDERHGDLIANPQDHPADWTSIVVGQRPDPNVVDREYQRIKREAVASGFRVA